MADVELVKKSLVRRTSTELDFGKIPPQNIELEESVLGAVMIEKMAIHEVTFLSTPEMFYRDAHQRIWKAILELSRKRIEIDTLTVVEQLKQQNDLDAAGGPLYIAQLTNKVGSAANIEYHARYLFEKYIQRTLISTSTEIIKTAYEDSCDPFELLDNAEKNLQQLQSSTLNGKVEDTAAQIDDAYNQIEKSASKDNGFIIESKHASINKNMKGWQRGTLNIIGARPKMGKSAFHVSELVHLVKTGKKVLSINPEMTKRQLYSRVFCNLAQINNNRLKNFELSDVDFKTLHQEIQWLKDNKQYLTCDFTGGIKLSAIRSLCRKVKMEKGLDVVFIDYLQLIKLDADVAKGKNRDQVIGEITGELKAIAKNMDVAMVVFCQLNRMAESKADKRPSMSELRESGNIEQDADTISFLLRPEYYFPKDSDGRTQFPTPQDEELFKGICQYFCDANREDVPFADEFRVNLGQSNFTDLSTHVNTPF